MNPQDASFQSFDACMKQAESAYRSFNDRRQMEWKVAFGFWTLIGAAIVLSPESPPRGTYIIVVCLYFLYLFWLWKLWCANDKDKQRQVHFRDEAENFLLEPGHALTEKFEINKEKLQFKEFIQDWSMLSHIGFTLVLLASFLFFAGKFASRKQSDQAQRKVESALTLAGTAANSAAKAASSAEEAARACTATVGSLAKGRETRIPKGPASSSREVEPSGKRK